MGEKYKIINLFSKLIAVVWISGFVEFMEIALHRFPSHRIISYTLKPIQFIWTVLLVFFVHLLQAISWLFIVLSYERWAIAFSSYFSWFSINTEQLKSFTVLRKQKQFGNLINDGGNCPLSLTIFWLFIEWLYFKRKIYFYLVCCLTFLFLLESLSIDIKRIASQTVAMCLISCLLLNSH